MAPYPLILYFVVYNSIIKIMSSASPPLEHISSLLRTSSSTRLASDPRSTSLIMADMGDAGQPQQDAPVLPPPRRTARRSSSLLKNNGIGGVINAGGGFVDDDSADEGVDIITGNIVYNIHHKKPFKSWARGALIRQICHSELATWYERTDKILNTITVTLTAISSSAIFAAVNPSVDSSIPSGKNYLSWGAGFVAVISTILQAIMKALSYASLAEQHKLAARQFTKVRFRLEIICGNNYVDDGHVNTDKVAEWIREYEELLDSTPVVPQKLFISKLNTVMNIENNGFWKRDTENDNEAVVEDQFNEDFLEPLISNEDRSA